MNQQAFPLKAIVGPARSGTTWAGALIDSSPEVIYRFEPFHRLATGNVEARKWMRRLKEQSVRESDVPAIYDLLCPANPLTNKAPFFDEKIYPLRTAGRRQLWPLARLIKPAREIYRAAYSPAPGPPIVFKEVTFVRQLRNILEWTGIPVVYLVRHPCATIRSSLGAPSGSSIASANLRVGEVLAKNAPELMERFRDVIDGTDQVKQHALMWLYEVQSCVDAVRASRNGMVLTYEQLADDAYAQGHVLFRHLGITFGENTRRFINGLYGLDSRGMPAAKRTGWGDRYFSVYRNPRETKDYWKATMPAEERGKVDSIVQGNAAVEYCAALGAWW